MDASSVRQRLSAPSVSEEQDGVELGIGVSSSRPASTPASVKWRNFAENIVWLAAALFILFYGDSRTNFFALIFADHRIRRLPFNLALTCLAINTGIFLYLAVWLRHVLQITANWDVVAPAAIPIATMIGLLATVLFAVAFWPVWSFLTLPLLFTLFMAFVIVASYIPPYVKFDDKAL